MKCVFGCDVLGVRLHGFPHPNQPTKILKKWLDIITNTQDINRDVKTFLQNSDSLTLHNSVYKVCDHHFKQAHKTQTGHIMYGGVPSVNLECILQSRKSCHKDHTYSSEKVIDGTQKPSNKPFRYIFHEDEDITNSKRKKDSVIVPVESKVNTDNLSSTEKIVIVINKQESSMKKVKRTIDNANKPNPDIVNRKTDDTIVDKTRLFSWQRDSEIVCDQSKCNTDNLLSTKKAKCTTDKENIPNTDNKPIDSDKDLHVGYKCDMCKGPIYRFRYACVQCVNFDLCGACEGRTAHAQHYLLRVPRPKPYGEVQQLINTMKKILSANIESLQSRGEFIDNLLDRSRTEVISNVESDPLPEEPDYSFPQDNDEEFELPTTKLKPSVSPKMITDVKVIEKRRKDREMDAKATTSPHKSIDHVAIDLDKLPTPLPPKPSFSPKMITDVKVIEKRRKDREKDRKATTSSHKSIDHVASNVVKLPTPLPPKPSFSPKMITDVKVIEKLRKYREKNIKATASPHKSIDHVAFDVHKHVPSNAKLAKMDTSSHTTLPNTPEKNSHSQPVKIKDDVNDSNPTVTPHTHTDEPFDIDEDITWLDEELLDKHEILHKKNANHLQDKQNLESKNTNEKRHLRRILRKSNHSVSSNKVNKTLVLALLKKASNGSNLVYTQNLLNTINHSLNRKCVFQ